jgi:alkylhydroperoxidase/carboxymuconolactone decarboxylase family protein YurZ
MIQRFVFDEVWRLPPLTVRDKALATVASLIAQSRPDQLRVHMKGFLSCGGTPDELRALILHLAVYCGFPAALAAFEVAKGLLDDEKTGPPRTEC